MNIVIVGLGKVGQLLTQYLSEEGHNVVVIDKNSSRIHDIVHQYDVLGITGNGANYDVLVEAGVDKADAVITVTTSDELNVLSCLISKRMGAKYTIARVRNPDYSRQKEFMRDQFGFSMMINPELEAANDIRRSILFPSAMKIDIFAKGKIELIEMRVHKQTKLHMIALNALSHMTKSNVLICAVKRKEDILIPNGDFVLKANDHIYVTGSHRDLSRFCLEMGFINQDIKNVMIVGGSKIAFYLAKQLSVQGIRTKIIEKDHSRCIELSQKLPYATIVEADGSSEEILREEGIHHCDAFIGLTGLDEENIVLTIMAKHMGVKKSIAKVNRISLNHISDQMGIDSIVEPKSIIASHIVGYLRAKSTNDEATSVQTLYKIVNDQVEALEFIVNEKTNYLNCQLMNIRLKNHLLIAGIWRDNTMIVPKGQDCLQIGDRIIVVTTQARLQQINDIFEENGNE